MKLQPERICEIAMKKTKNFFIIEVLKKIFFEEGVFFAEPALRSFQTSATKSNAVLKRRRVEVPRINEHLSDFSSINIISDDKPPFSLFRLLPE